MSTLIDYIQKRIYHNKPHTSSDGQYTFGRINPGDQNEILGLNQDSSNISGGWVFADEMDSSWNELYTLSENWTNNALLGNDVDTNLLPFGWVDYTREGWWCVDSQSSNNNIERIGLNPRNDMDINGGFPTDWDEETKISILNTITSFRPVSHVKSQYGVDLQAYYDGDSINHARLKSLSSAPNTVTLSFNLAESFQNNIPQYFSFEEFPYNFFNYHYFVVDWNWKPSGNYWGPGENDPFTNFNYVNDYFPKNLDDLADLNYDGLFSLRHISETIGHDYMSSGIKTIKVIFVTTMQNYSELEGGEVTTPSVNLTKYRWELIKELYEAAASVQRPNILEPWMCNWEPDCYNNTNVGELWVGGVSVGNENWEDDNISGVPHGPIWEVLEESGFRDFSFTSANDPDQSSSTPPPKSYPYIGIYQPFCIDYFTGKYNQDVNGATQLCQSLAGDGIVITMGSDNNGMSDWEQALNHTGLCLGGDDVLCYDPNTMHPLYWDYMPEIINGQYFNQTPEPFNDNNSVILTWGAETGEGWNEQGTDYVQAVDWKLLTIKLHLDDEGSLSLADYEDIGGDEYTYLPYPEIVDVMSFDENNDEINGLSPTGRYYKSSHPVISGLTENSTYVSSLNRILNENKFSTKEENEKILIKRAKELTPIGDRNEWGKFLGKVDLAQIRFFNNPYYDMTKLLNIDQKIITDIDEFYPYDDADYWDLNGTGGESFPEESPVGDIFISEYNFFKDDCLLEFNYSELENKSFSDSSGNTNKGILFGDFSLEKEDTDQQVNRDSYIKIPKLSNKDDGAF
tara:strand:- start:9037 stop:11427 length:2391 start_codon:yes stop_codon:yes gene_type:complete